jgi:phospholipid/cholesterol/gamma-HCH transport system substrate-binding protein
MKINRETQIGLLVTVALAMLIWGVNYLKGRNLLTSDNTYYAVYSKVDGLSESAPVLVNGYNIGKVARIQLNQKDDNQLVVTMEIDKDYEVPENT